jgi:hypothetical protein
LRIALYCKSLSPHPALSPEYRGEGSERNRFDLAARDLCGSFGTELAVAITTHADSIRSATAAAMRDRASGESRADGGITDASVVSSWHRSKNANPRN